LTPICSEVRRNGRTPYTSNVLLSVPGLASLNGGFQQALRDMKELASASTTTGAPTPYLFMLGFLIFVGLIAIGFRKKR
jgi:LPXTG-motif cell wall-anchored protein